VHTVKDLAADGGASLEHLAFLRDTELKETWPTPCQQ